MSAGDINNPTGNAGLMAVDKIGSRVLFLDPENYAELASLPMADRPHEVALSADHGLAYVSIYGSGVYGNNPRPGQTVAIIDLATRKHIGDIDLSPFRAPHGLMLAGDGLLYVSCDSSGVVAIVDPVRREVAGSIPTGSIGSHQIAMAGATWLYAENEDDQLFVSVMDVTAKQLVNQIPMPNGAAGIVASPDGQTVLVTDNKEPELAVIATASNSEVGRVRLRDQQCPAQRVRYSPSGDYVVVTSMEQPLVTVIDLTADDQATFTVAAGPMGVAFHPDGRTALVANHHAGQITVVDLESRRPTHEFAAGRGVETLAFY